MDDIIERAMQNDQMAMEQLMRTYYNEIYGYVYKALLDKDYAMDLTQEIFIRVFREIRKFDSSRSGFRTWLYLLATTELRHYMRKKRHYFDELKDTFSSDYRIEEEVSQREEIIELTKAISKLKKKEQQLISLRYYSELGLKEISEITNQPVSTIHYKLTQIEKKLRIMLGGMRDEG